MYIEGRSYFENETDESLEKYLQKYSGTGELLRDSNVQNKKWVNKERINIPELYGININPKNGKQEKTNTFIIHYSNTGVHIVPAHQLIKRRK